MIQHDKDKNEIDRDFSDITESNEVLRTCFRCGTRLMKSPIEGYTYFCPECYEDFYEFEQGKEN